MNKIDEILSRWSTNEETRIRGIILFDYYLARYMQIFAQKPTDIKHTGIGRKAMTNFFFVCLNSVSHDSYGLFDIFTRFHMVCGWQQRLISATYVDAERLGSMIPTFHLVNGCWVTRKGKFRSRTWDSLGTDHISDLIGSSSLAAYAQMIDDGIKNVIEKLPSGCFAEFKTQNFDQKVWSNWLAWTSQANFVEYVSLGLNKRSYNFKALMSLEKLLADKELLLQNL